MKHKEEYKDLEFEIITFDAGDLIVTSGDPVEDEGPNVG